MTQAAPRPKRPNLFLHWFKSIGEFFHILEGYAAAVAFISAAAAAIVVILSVQLSQSRERVVTTLLGILLGILLTAASISLVRLQRRAERLSEQYTNQRSAWNNLQRSLYNLDEFVSGMLLRHDLQTDEKRYRCVQLILTHCEYNTLLGIGPHSIRCSFLEYDAVTTRFRLTHGINLAAESENDVTNGLSLDSGLCGTVIRTRTAQYINDVMSPEAAAKGWKRVGADLRHSSIACAGAWLRDVPLGVISVDCDQVNVFTDDDMRVIEQFAHRVKLVYSAFPPGDPQQRWAR